MLFLGKEKLPFSLSLSNSLSRDFAIISNLNLDVVVKRHTTSINIFTKNQRSGPALVDKHSFHMRNITFIIHLLQRGIHSPWTSLSPQLWSDVFCQLLSTQLLQCVLQSNAFQIYDILSLICCNLCSFPESVSLILNTNMTNSKVEACHVGNDIEMLLKYLNISVMIHTMNGQWQTILCSHLK